MTAARGNIVVAAAFQAAVGVRRHVNGNVGAMFGSAAVLFLTAIVAVLVCPEPLAPELRQQVLTSGVATAAAILAVLVMAPCWLVRPCFKACRRRGSACLLPKMHGGSICLYSVVCPVQQQGQPRHHGRRCRLRLSMAMRQRILLTLTLLLCMLRLLRVLLQGGFLLPL